MLLLRHASAGAPLSSPTLDRERGLDQRGRADADRLAGTFDGHDVKRIVTSPYARCVETVLPLALARGLELEFRHELSPEASGKSTRALLDELPKATIVCTHREVIERLFDGEVECEKAGAWLLESAQGRWSTSEYYPPPSAVERTQAAFA